MKFFNFCFPQLATQSYTSTSNLSESAVETYTLEDIVNILEQLSNYLENSHRL